MPLGAGFRELWERIDILAHPWRVVWQWRTCLGLLHDRFLNTVAPRALPILKLVLEAQGLAALLHLSSDGVIHQGHRAFALALLHLAVAAQVGIVVKEVEADRHGI